MSSQTRNEAYIAYVLNRSFREVIDTGLYLYTEGHYCLKSSKYIVYDQYGRRHLTHYARTHMSECCLVFEISYDNAIAAIKNSVLCKSHTDGKRIKFRKQSGESLLTEEGKELRRRAQEAVNAKQRIKRSFGDITVEKALNGDIDIILCKSISHWGRNTVDALRTIKLLDGNHVRMIFEQENIDTSIPGAVLQMNLAAAIAQSESESNSLKGTSKNLLPPICTASSSVILPKFLDIRQYACEIYVQSAE